MNTKEEIKLQSNIATITAKSIIATQTEIPTSTGEVVIKFDFNDNKSILEIGNVKIYNIKKFNWFHRLMFKLVFGIKIENIKETK